MRSVATGDIDAAKVRSVALRKTNQSPPPMPVHPYSLSIEDNAHHEARYAESSFAWIAQLFEKGELTPQHRRRPYGVPAPLTFWRESKYFAQEEA
jgi:hypothetical protein